jgi:hypothetical protein
VNLGGFLSHAAELHHRLALADFPDIVAVTETFLDKSVSEVDLEGYCQISRLDRRDGRKCGGVAVFSKLSFAQNVVHVGDSPEYERSWHIVHTNHGPLLFSVWYRPPCHGEVESILEFEREWEQHRHLALGTLVVGDMNVHSTSWLKRKAIPQKAVPCKWHVREWVWCRESGSRLVERTCLTWS